MREGDPLRRDYDGPALLEQDVSADPVEQFARWFDEAVAAGVTTANAMTLATVSETGFPEARIVLLKGYDSAGFVFFTNYGSAKAYALEASGKASLLFFWERLERQVRIEGTVTRVDDAESDAYFATRPRAANLGAMASSQSSVVGSRAELEARVAELEATWAGRELVRPPTWGGYRVSPLAVEFWQGRPDRLHDRLRFSRDAESWRRERLAP